MITVLLVILLLVAVTAFFVAAEFAAVAVRTVRIQALAENGSGSAARIFPILKDPGALDRYVAACQVGITLSSLVLGAYGQVHLHHFFSGVLGDRGLALAVVLILLTGFHVVLGELLPKAVALRFPERVVLSLTYPMLFCLWMFGWAIHFLNGTGNLILRWLGVPLQSHRHVHSPEELAELVRRGNQAGTLEAEESRLLERAFHFGKRCARECMVPRTRIAALDLNEPTDALLRRVADSTFSRLPVYRGGMDHVEGYVHVKDLVGTEKLVVQPILTLPASVTVEHAFAQMRAQGTQIVLLLDEYGGTAGMLTMEDVLEQLLGDIRDEFDPGDSSVRFADGEWIADGDTPLKEVARVTGCPFPANGTLAGWLLERLGRSPRAGDVVKDQGLWFKILEVSGLRVLKVRCGHA